MATPRATSIPDRTTWAAITRPHFFTGRLLTTEDLEAEQAYHRAQRRRLARAVLGWGIVDGLSVAIERGPKGGVRIAAGVALDATGELIEVPCPQQVTLPLTGARLHLVLAFAEEPCDPIPAPGGTGDTGSVHSRVRETFRLALEARPAVDALVLARIVRSRTRWQLDRGFRRRRLARRRGAGA